MDTDIEIELDEDTRAGMAEGLSRLLADTYTLYLRTHGYHWNVTGPSFYSLHQMFEDQYVELWKAVDEIAERIRALGSWAPASHAELGRLAALPDEEGVPEAGDMVGRLAEAHQTVLQSARLLAERAGAAGDRATEDLVIERIEAHEKAVWMLNATAS